MFKFEFCVEVQGLVDPPDCQSADIYANVLEDAVNEGVYNHHVDDDHEDGDHRALEHIGDLTVADANITRIGGVSLTKVDGSTVCGGTLGGQEFINELTGTVPDIAGAAQQTQQVCGVITVEEQECRDVACLEERYHGIVEELDKFVWHGDLTLAINRRSFSRLPPVPELWNVTVVPFTLETKNLLLPATFTGDLDLKYYFGSDLYTCMEKPKAALLPNELPFDNLAECCNDHFWWGVEQCCELGGGCTDVRRRRIEAAATEDTGYAEPRFFPTWEKGKLCDSKRVFESWENPPYTTLDECCEEYFPSDTSCMNPTAKD